jgi:hypothetical protein
MPSAKLADPHPVNQLGDHDLGMLAIASIAAEDAGAAFPAHGLVGTPNRTYRDWPRPRAQLFALACFPRLASGQSLFAGHQLLLGALRDSIAALDHAPVHGLIHCFAGLRLGCCHESNADDASQEARRVLPAAMTRLVGLVKTVHFCGTNGLIRAAAVSHWSTSCEQRDAECDACDQLH